MSLLLQFLFPLSSSLFVNTLSFIIFIASVNSGLSEFRGNHVAYSKFWSSNDPQNETKMALSSRIGMLISYIPALLVSLVCLISMSDFSELRMLLLCSALSLHFIKRILEVLYVHKYSGQMSREAVILVSLSYLAYTITIIYTQSLTKGNTEPTHDLKFVGLVLLFIGITGNFYHHFLLSKLRNEGERAYKIPKGGLFDLVICPHYLFEIIEFIGIACVSQTLYGISFTLASIFYLMGRSYATRKWYISKFENFPRRIKALIPYMF